MTTNYINLIDNDEIIRWGSGEIKIIGCSFTNESGEEIKVCEWGENFTVGMLIRVFEDVDCEHIGFGFSFRDKNGLDIIVSTTIEEGKEFGPLKKGDEIEIKYELENILAPGEYLITFQSEDRTYFMPKYYDFVENAIVFKVIADRRFFSLTQPRIKQTINFHESEND